jgi:hypothetical protein
VSHFGLKEHATVDVENGLILSINITAASHSDTTYLPYATIYSMHTAKKSKWFMPIRGMRALRIADSFR